jgi:hypothetical protein
MNRRAVALSLLASLALLAFGGPAWAQGGFPARVVKFIVPFPPGGINDVLARILADKLLPRWGQTIVVENKTGAGGNIGADLAAHAEPDGHTLFLAPPGPLAVNQSLYKQLLRLVRAGRAAQDRACAAERHRRRGDRGIEDGGRAGEVPRPVGRAGRLHADGDGGLHQG